jgi:hypothetical protein
MPIELRELIDQLTPSNTVLVFGAGASLPSGAPSVSDLVNDISTEFKIEPDGLNLAEISAVAEMKRNRTDLIALLRKRFRGLKAKSSLLNLPRHDWKSIYTTNYDELVEDAYRRAERPLQVFSSDFDFKVQPDPTATKYFKIHGTISKDSIDGSVFNLILTQMDYDSTADYREALYARLRSDMSPGSQVVVIGQSLTDAHLREMVEAVIATNQKVGAGGRVFLLLYEKNENRALLYEQRGLRVAFGSLDAFMAAMETKAPATETAYRDTGSPLDTFQALRPVTLDVGEEADTRQANASGIFNGWPARYPDIAGGLTFDRSCVDEILKFIESGGGFVCLLGASGVGKTTAARQAMLRLKARGYFAWEHKSDFPLQTQQWLQAAKRLTAAAKIGVLFVDDAHTQLYELNNLVDDTHASGLKSLRIVCAAARNHWAPRIKTPHIYKNGREINLSRLDHNEIDRLLHLVDTNPELQKLVEAGFSGFSRAERRRRLLQRCEADMFVCLKNVFASEKFDDIILREFGDLDSGLSDVYRYVAAMESAGIRVHRQLVVRLLGISADAIPSILSGLLGIISEYEINKREGIYGWKVRHDVIAAIIARYKFYQLEQQIELFGRVIDNISPTYDIEVRTIRELCNIETGLPRIPDRNVQNNLLRRMMSIAPRRTSR